MKQRPRTAYPSTTYNLNHYIGEDTFKNNKENINQSFLQNSNIKQKMHKLNIKVSYKNTFSVKGLKDCCHTERVRTYNYRINKSGLKPCKLLNSRSINKLKMQILKTKELTLMVQNFLTSPKYQKGKEKQANYNSNRGLRKYHIK